MKSLDLNAGSISFGVDVSTLFLVLGMQHNPAYVQKVMTYLTNEVLARDIYEFRCRFPNVKIVLGSDAVAFLPIMFGMSKNLPTKGPVVLINSFRAVGRPRLGQHTNGSAKAVNYE